MLVSLVYVCWKERGKWGSEKSLEKVLLRIFKLMKWQSIRLWFLCLTLVLWMSPEGCCQSSNKVIDSLEALVLKGQPDDELLRNLATLAQLKSNSNRDSAIAYAQQAVALSDQLQELVPRIKARRLLGEMFFRAEMIDSLEAAAHRSLDVATACEDSICYMEQLQSVKLLRVPLRRRGDIIGIVRMLEDFRDQPNLPPWYQFEARRLISFPLLDLGDYDAALQELSLVWQYAQEVNDQEMMCNLLGELANTYGLMGQLEKSLAVGHRRLRTCQAINRAGAVAHSLNYIGVYHLKLEQYDSAFWYFGVLVDMVDTGDYFYPYAIGGLVQSGHDVDPRKTENYVELAKALLRMNETADRPNWHLGQYLYGILSKYYMKVGRYHMARSYAERRLAWVHRYQSDTTDMAVESLELVAKTQAASGDHAAAMESYVRFHELKMAMVNRNQEDALARTAVEMDLAENELARRRAEQATRLERQISSARARLFIILLLVAGVIVFVILWAYRSVQKDRQIIQEKNQQIKESLAEKEVLLREIHHRVKNNLQIISSLLDKQARKSTDDAVRKLVREGQERIQSMALIHQNLYESDQLSGIDIRTYLLELSANIQRSQAVDTREIQLELNVEEQKLDIDTAIPVGLILNELITNCYKYAFVGRPRGKISVGFKKNEEGYALLVEDDGVGFSPMQDQAKTRSLGLNLVRGLVRQLEGRLEWLQVEQGTAVAIRF